MELQNHKKVRLILYIPLSAASNNLCHLSRLKVDIYSCTAPSVPRYVNQDSVEAAQILYGTLKSGEKQKLVIGICLALNAAPIHVRSAQ